MLRALIVILALLPLARALHAGCGGQPMAAVARAPVVSMNSWFEAQKKRKDMERKQYEEIAARDEARKAEREAAMAEQEAERKRVEAERNAAIQAFQDNQDFSRPGAVARLRPGEVTREMLLNSRKTTSPAIAADEAVKQALDEVSALAPAEAVELLERVLGQAGAAGTSPNSPNVKKARSLQAQLQTASDAVADTKTTDPQKASFDALFGGGYAMDLPDDID